MAEQAAEIREEKKRTVWEHYNEKANDVDRDLVKDWNETLDGLLIFAGLFSAILTAFAMESYTKLQPDNQEVLMEKMLLVLTQLNGANEQAPYSEPFQPSARDVALNVLLFASLAISVVVAMSFLIVKQWIRGYDRGMLELRDPWDKAKVRQLRYEGIETWRLSAIVATLPLLMMVSLLMFAVGISIIVSINKIILAIVVAIFGVGSFAYLATLSIGALKPASPFWTPLSDFISSRLGISVAGMLDSPEDQPTERFAPVVQWRALEWLASRTPLTSRNVPTIRTIVGELAFFPGCWRNYMAPKEFWRHLIRSFREYGPMRPDKEQCTIAYRALVIFDELNPQPEPDLDFRWPHAHLAIIASSSEEANERLVGFLSELDSSWYRSGVYPRYPLPDPTPEPRTVEQHIRAVNDRRRTLRQILPNLSLGQSAADVILIKLFEASFFLTIPPNTPISHIDACKALSAMSRYAPELIPDILDNFLVRLWRSLTIPPLYSSLSPPSQLIPVGRKLVYTNSFISITKEDIPSFLECFASVLRTGPTHYPHGGEIEEHFRTSLIAMFPLLIEALHSFTTLEQMTWDSLGMLLLFASMPSFDRAWTRYREVSRLKPSGNLRFESCLEAARKPDEDPVGEVIDVPSVVDWTDTLDKLGALVNGAKHHPPDLGLDDGSNAQTGEPGARTDSAAEGDASFGRDSNT